MHDERAYRVLRMGGISLLIFYFICCPSFEFSPLGVLGYFLISTLIAIAFVVLRIAGRFAKLNQYHFFPISGEQKIESGNWVADKAAYVISMTRGRQILYSVTEDGLICVPLLLVGLNFATSFIGGVIFGFMHIGRFTYLECLVKALIYCVVCLVILPQGILTVIAGHLTLNLIALAVAERAPNVVPSAHPPSRSKAPDG